MDEAWLGLVGVLFGALISIAGTIGVEWFRTSKAQKREDELAVRSHVEEILEALLSVARDESASTASASMVAAARLNMRLPRDRDRFPAYAVAVGSLLTHDHHEGMKELAQIITAAPQWIRGDLTETELHERIDRIDRRIEEVRAADGDT